MTTGSELEAAMAHAKKRSSSPASKKPLAENAPTYAAAVESKPSAIQARFVQCYLLMGTRIFQQAMRNAIAPLIVFMADDLGIGVGQKGMLISATAAGYFFTQVPGGQLAETFGSKIIITTALALSALCCILSPISADVLGVPGLWGMMALLGAVQGPLFPASFVFLSRWMPKTGPSGTDEKAWGTSMLDIGISIGSLLVIPVSSGIAGLLGWRFALYIIGLASLAFVGVWHLLSSEEPKNCSFISDAELKLLEANQPKPKANGDDATKQGKDRKGFLGLPANLALHHGMWAVFVAHMAFNFGAYYLTNWSPTYYAEVLKLSPADAKYHLMMPHVTNLATKSANPFLIGLVDKQGLSLLSNRKLFTAAGFLLAAAALLPVHQLRGASPWVSTVLLSAANAFFGLSPSGFKANYLDITEKCVGSVSGIGNSLATVSSWVGPQFVAYLLSQFQSWDLVLGSVAVINVLAALIYVRWATVTPMEQDSLAHKKKE